MNYVFNPASIKTFGALKERLIKRFGRCVVDNAAVTIYEWRGVLYVTRFAPRHE